MEGGRIVGGRAYDSCAGSYVGLFLIALELKELGGEQFSQIIFAESISFGKNFRSQVVWACCRRVAARDVRSVRISDICEDLHARRIVSQHSEQLATQTLQGLFRAGRR